MTTKDADGAFSDRGLQYVDLTKEDIDRLLHELADVLASRCQQVDVYVVGGANIALALDASRTTTDIDVVVKRGLEALESACAKVAENNPGVRPDWINPDFTGEDRSGGITWFWFDQKDADIPTTYLDTPSLKVSLAGPEMMLALKTLAARDKDIADIIKLMDVTGIRTRQQLGDNVRKFTGDRFFQNQGQPWMVLRISQKIDEILSYLPQEKPVKPWWRRRKTQ